MMRALIMLALLISLSGNAFAKPTDQECKIDPRRDGCQKWDGRF